MPREVEARQGDVDSFGSIPSHGNRTATLGELACLGSCNKLCEGTGKDVAQGRLSVNWSMGGSVAQTGRNLDVGTWIESPLQKLKG